MATLAAALRGSSVSELSLSGCNLNSDVVHPLFDSIKDNSKLMALDVSCNSIDDRGLEVLAQALRNNATLQSMSMDWNKHGGRGVAAIAKSLEHNMCLRFLDVRFALGATNIKAGTEMVIELLQTTKNDKLIVDARIIQRGNSVDYYVLGLAYPDDVQRRLFGFPLRSDVCESGRTLRGGPAVRYSYARDG